jgi:hypothetical protein
LLFFSESSRDMYNVFSVLHLSIPAVDTSPYNGYCKGGLQVSFQSRFRDVICYSCIVALHFIILYSRKCRRHIFLFLTMLICLIDYEQALLPSSFYPQRC